MSLDLDDEMRRALWNRLASAVETHRSGLRERPIVGTTDRELEIGTSPSGDAMAVLDAAIAALEAGVVHTDHPRYFGLFNSAPATLGAIADALVSEWNPQLATRGHATWPVAVEERLITELGERFGYLRDHAFGTFTSGGGEANTTAVLCALSSAFPEVGERGVRALPGEPRIYVSAEGHATITRAARVAGLGGQAVRVIPVDASLRMKTQALAEVIAADRREGDMPIMVVATAGTTSAGVIDPIGEIANLAERHGTWFHVDAAWGGLAALVPELRHTIAGVERADSITFDPHKVMSAPMGTGALLTRREGVLERVFADRTGYMPRDGSRDPYARSLAWSRRFVGLRVLLPLAAAGWDGYAASLRREVTLANLLRERLRASGWAIVNDTPLPVVCFTDRVRTDAKFLDAVARDVIATSGGWISVPRFATGTRALRACVNNHRSEERDIEALVTALDAARARQ